MNYKRLIRDLIVAVLSALLTFFTSSCMTSCSSVWIKGSDNNPVIDHSPKFSADSTSFLKITLGNTKEA